MKSIRVAVAGLGVVGSETARLIRRAEPEFLRRLGARVEIAAVFDRRASLKMKRLGLGAKVRRAADWRGLARDPEIDVVVETLGGLDPARGLVLESLKSGKRVVTANKRLLAEHWDEIMAASRDAGRSIRFEASVAGGIPILKALGESLAGDRVRRVLGILNGTTNFILTRMEQEGGSFDQALKEAQRLGFAERDPRMDLDGSDAAHKVAVIASLLTGRGLKPQSVARQGILGIGAADIRFAAEELGRVIRLLGSVEIEGNGKIRHVRASVRPALVPLDHPLARVQDENNAVLVEAEAAGELLFQGKGAGPGPAGSAVAGDVFLACRDALNGGDALPVEPGSAPAFGQPAEEHSAFYLRLAAADKPGVLSRVTDLLGKRGVSVSRVAHGRLPYSDETGSGRKTSAKTSRSGEGRTRELLPVFLITHSAGRGEMDRALRDILSLPSVSKEHLCLPLR